MKKLSLFILLLALTSLGISQVTTVDKLMKMKPIGVPVHPTPNDSNIVYLTMDFSSSQFVKDYSKLLPKDRNVVGVHLVYTKYREVDTFNQPLLNRARYDNLKSIWPEIFNIKGLQWRAFEQTKAKTEEEAKTFYHGFIVFLQAKPKLDKLKAEKDLMKFTLGTYRDSMVEIPGRVIYKKRKRLVETGYFLANDPEKRQQGIKFKTQSIWFREKEYKTVVDSVVAKRIKPKKKKIGKFDSRYLKNTDVFEALSNRNWKGNWTLVTDVTGSMGPFSTQVLLFLKYNAEVLKMGRFSFFNDGNGAPELIKRIGSSGGIYNVASSNFDSIYRTIITAMENGNGGDIPENNIEAILTATKRFPQTDSILMIADASAPIKDIALLKQVKKPVFILLCGGVNGSVPFDYYMLAKETGGGIIQTDEELRGLMKYKIGDRIEAGERTYKVSNLGLVLVADE